MRAWQVTKHGEPREALTLRDTAPPEPGPGQLRLRVLGAAVGFPDLSLCRGAYALTPPLPFTPGQEAVGFVTAAGPGARAREGERVMAVSAFFLGHGSFAEQCLALDDFAFSAPDDMDDTQAAGFTIPFHTAWVALVRRAALAPGENVLVLGAAGGTGSAAVQLAKALGARVIATAGGADKAAFCRRLGADVVVDYRSDDIARAVRDATGGRGVEVAFDAVGGTAFDAATRCIAHEGRLLLVGFAGGSFGQPRAEHLVERNYSVLGVIPSAYDRAFREDAQRGLLEHFRAGRLRPCVHDVVPFEKIPEAVGRIADGEVLGRQIIAAPR
ncbi:MAG: NADPH:quinone oxidoreductase family protein [Myxococcota bacterium]|nr:NADPH:quinone oxidoreductase family protein [Myxococcota bacterium]